MMKNYLGWSAVVAALTLLTAGPALAQATGGSAPAAFPPTSFLTPAKATWESTRGLVLGIAEIFPEDKYDFKPTPAVRTLRENLIHLIGENYFFFSKVTGETLPSNARFNELKTRDEILKELRASYEYDAKVWDTLTEAKALELVEGRNNQKVQRWSFILGAIQDNMNHYGNLVVYARLNGLVPPRSAGR
ncbi:MAG TPA: DinB family protein [Methylomirabilota bacterium]|nr:DinB family protein [Methylomirabilota bacterium]